MKNNKALLFTRVEAGNMQVFPLELYEHELHTFTDVIKKEVFCKVIGKKLNTRVVKIGKLYVKALFFKDGTVYDVDLNGFAKRENYSSPDSTAFINKLYKEKSA